MQSAGSQVHVQRDFRHLSRAPGGGWRRPPLSMRHESSLSNAPGEYCSVDASRHRGRTLGSSMLNESNVSNNDEASVEWDELGGV